MYTIMVRGFEEREGLFIQSPTAGQFPITRASENNSFRSAALILAALILVVKILFLFYD
jgi:hypothetical protein